VHQVREQGPEQAWSQQEAGQDLAGHLGLAEPAHDSGHEPGREEDHDELVQQAERDLLRAGADRGFRGRGTRKLRPDRRDEHYA